MASAALQELEAHLEGLRKKLGLLLRHIQTPTDTSEDTHRTVQVNTSMLIRCSFGNCSRLSHRRQRSHE